MPAKHFTISPQQKNSMLVDNCDYLKLTLILNSLSFVLPVFIVVIIATLLHLMKNILLYIKRNRTCTIESTNFGPVEVVKKQPIITNTKRTIMFPTSNLADEKRTKYVNVPTGNKIPIYETVIKTRPKKIKVKRQKIVNVMKEDKKQFNEYESYSDEEEFMEAINYYATEWDHYTQSYNSVRKTDNVMKKRKARKFRTVPKTQVETRWVPKREEYDSEEEIQGEIEEYEEKEIVGYKDEYQWRPYGFRYDYSKQYPNHKKDIEFKQTIGFKFLEKEIHHKNYSVIATINCSSLISASLNSIITTILIRGAIVLFCFAQLAPIIYQIVILQEHYFIAPIIVAIVDALIALIAVVVFVLTEMKRRNNKLKNGIDFWCLWKMIFSDSKVELKLDIESFKQQTGVEEFEVKKLTQHEIDEELKVPEYEYSLIWKRFVEKQREPCQNDLPMIITPNYNKFKQHSNLQTDYFGWTKYFWCMKTSDCDVGETEGLSIYYTKNYNSDVSVIDV